MDRATTKPARLRPPGPPGTRTPSASARRGTRTPDASARLGLARRAPVPPGRGSCPEAAHRAQGVDRRLPPLWAAPHPASSAGPPCTGRLRLCAGDLCVRASHGPSPVAPTGAVRAGSGTRQVPLCPPVPPWGSPWTKSLGEERMPTAVAAARRSARGGAGRVGGMGDRPRGGARLLHGVCRPGRGTGRRGAGPAARAVTRPAGRVRLRNRDGWSPESGTPRPAAELWGHGRAGARDGRVAGLRELGRVPEQPGGGSPEGRGAWQGPRGRSWAGAAQDKAAAGPRGVPA
ncbi:hypothetical protein SUDANB38_04349 [Streptomyces sp. enrichment culture]